MDIIVPNNAYRIYEMSIVLTYLLNRNRKRTWATKIIHEIAAIF